MGAFFNLPSPREGSGVGNSKTKNQSSFLRRQESSHYIARQRVINSLSRFFILSQTK